MPSLDKSDTMEWKWEGNS